MIKNKTLLLMAAIVVAIILIAFDTQVAEGISCAAILSMGLIGNIDDVNDRESAGKQIACRVWLVSADQIDRTKNFPIANVDREIGDVPLKAGEHWHYIEAHINPTDDTTMEKGDINTTATNTLGLVVGGNSAQILNFIENHAGGKFIIITQNIDDDKHRIHGSDKRPMFLKTVTRSNNAEKSAVELKFENNSFAQPYVYVGSLSEQAPLEVTSAVVAISTNSRYNIGGTVAITSVTGVTASDIGRIVHFYGTGGNANAQIIAESSAFVLAGGTQWSATAGSRIDFRILDTSTLVEVLGSRVQR
ncbi:MAG: hypothetical protein RR277_00955 [Rikenellaceae bacterium]